MKLLLATTLYFVSFGLTAQTHSTETATSQKENSSVIVASFTANVTTICVGETIQFSDISSGSPNTWNWQFSGGSPANSTVQNPAVQYNSVGTYNVILNASNGSDQNTVGKLNYIRVEVCSDLYTNSIEQNFQVFPIPAANLLYIRSYSDASFTLMNVSGQVVRSGAVIAGQTTELSIEKLAAGIYTLKSESQGYTFVRKIVVE